MDATTKSRTTHKGLFAVMASILACFALVMSLVPVQAMADQDSQGTETATEASGGDISTVTVADGGDGVELVPVDIPRSDDNLIYTGKQQLLLKADKSILVDISNSETPPVWDEDKKDPTGQTGTYYGTNAGKYTFTVTPRAGYKWSGGGHEPVDVTFEIAAAELDKATIISVPSAVVFDNEPATPQVTIKTADGKTLVQNTDYKLEYKNNEDKNQTGTVYITGLNNYTGLTHKNFKIVDRQGIFRLYNPNSGEHFFTTSKVEHDHLVSVGWNTEGISWYAPTESANPVYRLYNPNAGDHHYTTSKAEYDHLGKVGWKQEGTAFYSDEEAKTPVLRAYNPNAKAGAHHFTISVAERNNLVVAGWTDEGTGWYAASVK